jgi:hypothetical protein
MSRGATGREERFFRKTEIERAKIKRSRKRKIEIFSEILRLRKMDRGSKDVASLSIRVVLSKKSGPTSYRNRGHL